MRHGSLNSLFQVEGLLDALAVEGVVPTEYESAQVASPTKTYKTVRTHIRQSGGMYKRVRTHIRQSSVSGGSTAGH